MVASMLIGGKKNVRRDRFGRKLVVYADRFGRAQNGFAARGLDRESVFPIRIVKIGACPAGKLLSRVVMHTAAKVVEQNRRRMGLYVFIGFDDRSVRKRKGKGKLGRTAVKPQCACGVRFMEFNIRLFIRFFSNFLEGYGVTIQYAVVGIILSLIAGLVIGLTLCLRPAVATPILRGYITFFRETPLLVQMYLLYYGLPYIGVMISAPVAGLLGIVLNEGAFIAEIIRGGIEALPAGQRKAALSLGFTELHSLLRIELPQAFRAIIPSLTNQVSYILQDTALFTLITIPELTTVARALNSKYLIPGTAYIGAAIFYIATFWVIQLLSNALQRRRKWN